MDAVPLDFSERVCAMRKCCKWTYCKCVKAHFVAPKWNESEKDHWLWSTLYFATVDGKWKYGIENPENSREFVTINELTAFPNYQNVRIYLIYVIETDDYSPSARYDIVDVKKLLKFVSFLSNEPSLQIGVVKPDLFSPEGGEILEWLKESSFSYISVRTLTPLQYQIIEKQMLKRKPTEIEVRSNIEGNVEFLENRLMSGDLRRLSVHDHVFPANSLQRLIQNVLEAPEDFGRSMLDIKADFEYSAKGMMDEMAENRLCVFEDLRRSWKYTFTVRSVVLTVEKFGARWNIRCV